MTVAAPFTFENTFHELEGLYVPWRGATFPEPRMLVFNDALAAELGVEGVTAEQLLGAEGVAQVYSGHQFGAYSGRLGDGRALLLGELVDVHGRRRDVHLKGSGRTPFARGGDGKAVVAPMLREYVIGEAMHALGIPTSRALAVIATGERVMRDGAPFPGAVLVRVAASHIRVGTFEYAARHADVRQLADYSMRRHHPDAESYLDFYTRVVDAQAALIARWMLVGFIHGVMNTDNMAISGETIDYGPCAFMDAYDPATVYSSIDYGGRYAYGNQPAIAAWNLARFGETLLNIIDAADPVKAVTEVLETFDERFKDYWLDGMRAKLGVSDDALVTEFLSALRGRDYTSAFSPKDGVNPIYIPRNHLVEEALTAATAGDMEPFQRLVDVVARPFEERPGLERYAQPAPADFGPFITYCGT